jgi:NADPH:quinone reductase-like Zn-dependent oxidoreductase
MIPNRIPTTMKAVRLHEPGGTEALSIDEIPVPEPAAGELLVRVHAAALTRDELTWPTDRLPAIPSYELSGVVATAGGGFEQGDAVYSLTGFERDGVAAEYAAVPADRLAHKPTALDDVHAAALPLAGLSAWQALVDHGGLAAGQRVLIHGAAGGVGHLATQLAHERGAYVIGTATGRHVAELRALGADEAIDREGGFDGPAAVDLVFDTVGGIPLAGSPALLAPAGRIVSVAEEMPEGVDGTYFVVEPNADQLEELGRLAGRGALVPSIGAVYPLAEARAAFEHLARPDKRGKVVLDALADTRRKG